jgi:hypothetical protein
VNDGGSAAKERYQRQEESIVLLTGFESYGARSVKSRGAADQETCPGLFPDTPLLRLERIMVNVAEFEIPDKTAHVTRGPVVEARQHEQKRGGQLRPHRRRDQIGDRVAIRAASRERRGPPGSYPPALETDAHAEPAVGIQRERPANLKASLLKRDADSLAAAWGRLNPTRLEPYSGGGATRNATADQRDPGGRVARLVEIG